jgi:hypothetical protein
LGFLRKSLPKTRLRRRVFRFSLGALGFSLGALGFSLGSFADSLKRCDSIAFFSYCVIISFFWHAFFAKKASRFFLHPQYSMSIQIPTILSGLPTNEVIEQSAAQPQTAATSYPKSPSRANSTRKSISAPPRSLSTPVQHVDGIQDNQQIIILHTVDVSDEDLATLRTYGPVVEYDINCEGSLPINSLIFTYLLLDLRKLEARRYYDSQETIVYPTIVYISRFETFDQLIEDLKCDNVITEFPPRQHFQADYNRLLLNNATGEPSKCLSLVTYMVNFFAALKRR